MRKVTERNDVELVRLGIAGFIVSLLLSLAIWPAMAHSGTPYFALWAVASRDVPWKFAEDFPTGNERDRVKDGAREWNQEGQSMTFNHTTPDSPANYQWDSCSSTRPYQKNVVHWVVLGNTLSPAAVKTCLTPNGGLHDFQMALDRDDEPEWNWFVGTGNPGTDRLDMWSVAAHEFGHATGWGPHFQAIDSSICTGDFAARPTMCGGTPDYWENGRIWQRSLQTHDKHEFSEVY